MTIRWVLVVMIALLVSSGCADADGDAEDGTHNAEAPASPLDGAQETWWGWAAEEPESTNPVSDATGKQCARNQPADVWLLAGNFGGSSRRTCKLPAGRPVVAPVVNYIGDRRDCVTFLQDASGTATIDGKKLHVNTLQPESIQFQGADGNPVSGTGSMAVTACGLWITTDIEPGEHELEIIGASGDFNVHVTYKLVVGKA